ncbi:PAS domain S-box protein [Anatilimnocola sp. NA78]|uniref:PAS domain S-box protein n=1 Tax=Anatilimnocola sp. NA78 TaxID=3415683 RepID=UPI003CE4A50F
MQPNSPNELVHTVSVLRATLEATQDAILITDLTGRITEYNARLLEVWCLPPDAVKGKSLSDFLDLTAHLCEKRSNHTDYDFWLNSIQNASGSDSAEWQLVDGRTIACSSHSQVMHDTTVGHVWGFRDITALRQFDELRGRLDAIVDSADDAIISKTTTGFITGWNRGAKRIFGYSEEEVIGKPVTILIPADRLGEESEILAKIARSERVEHYETERIRKDGKRIHVSLTVSPIKDGKGAVVGASKIARDVSERKRTDQAKFLLAAIVDSSDDAIISKNLQSIITSWNSSAEQLFGYSAQEAIGRPITMLFPAELLSDETQIVSRIAAGERIKHYATERVRKDGKRIPVSITVSPVRNAEGKVVGASKIARDVTEQLRHESERDALLKSERAARSEAEHASHLKDEFLATVSHELRTPLNAILGWSQLLSTVRDDASLDEGLEIIQRNARIQAQLVEDLLDMSRIVSGKFRLEVQIVDLASVIESAMESVRPAADAKSITLRKVLDPLAGPINGDPTRLQQILWNLLSNAIKFTSKGGKVDVYLERVNSHIEITVRDNGAGINPDFLPIIFERFRQVDSSTTRRHGGLGLGLAIVKHLVELHGGTVRAKSAGEGQGSTFNVHLPTAPLLQAAKREHPTASRALQLDCNQISLENVKVLLVDDEPDTRTFVKRLLSECGAVVQTSHSADDAIKMIQGFGPHIIISDIGMPGKDGYEFVRELRSRKAEDGGQTPAIALTAFARSEDRTRALLAGYQIHITKPIEPQELLVTVFSLSKRAAT